MLRDRRERVGRVEPTPQHERRGQREPELEVGEAPGVEQRRRDQRPLPGAQRDPREDRDQRPDRLRLRARGALGRSGRARGQDHEPARRCAGGSGGDGSPSAISCSSVGSGRLALLHPRHEPLAAAARIGDQLGELLVVHERGRLLTLGHLRELRTRERRVHQQGVSAELRARDRGLDEPAVVAAHDRDPVARLQAGVGPRVREPVRPVLELRERDDPELVDDRLGLRVQGGVGDRRGRGGHLPASECESRSRGAVRPHGPGVPRADQRGRRASGVVDRIDSGRASRRALPAAPALEISSVFESEIARPSSRSRLPVRAARKSGSRDDVSESSNEPRLDWSTAEVSDGRLTVALDGERPKGWKRSFETVAQLLTHGEGSPVTLKKHEVRVSGLRPGDEEKVRHLLESVVQQANADHRPPEEEQRDEDGEDEETVPLEEIGQSSPDAEMADRFRSFGTDDAD